MIWSGETMEAILEHQNMDYEKIGKKNSEDATVISGIFKKCIGEL